MAKQVYTIAEVAELLEFSEQTIREWIRRGHIKAARPGVRAWRIPASEVERLMQLLDSGHSLVQNSPDQQAPMLA